LVVASTVKSATEALAKLKLSATDSAPGTGQQRTIARGRPLSLHGPNIHARSGPARVAALVGRKEVGDGISAGINRG
jgi:hypothetical protein